jgi:hypothetical protein
MRRSNLGHARHCCDPTGEGLALAGDRPLERDRASTQIVADRGGRCRRLRCRSDPSPPAATAPRT